MSRHPMARGARLPKKIPWTLALTALMAVTMVAVPAFASHDAGDPNPATTSWLEEPVAVSGNDSQACPSGSFFWRLNGDADGGTDADLETGTYVLHQDGTTNAPAGTNASFILTVPTDGGVNQDTGVADNSHNGAAKTLDFEIIGGSAAEIRMKGGPDHNLYDYADNSETAELGELSGGSPVTFDDYLHSPPRGGGQFFGLSHITVCFETVGQLKVQKFIDVDADGILDAGDVTSSDANLAGWEFKVYEGSDTSGTLVATLTTDSDGMAGPIALPAGTYTVEETNTGRTITTAVTGGSTTEITTLNPVTDDVVAGETTTYTFGNACLITKVFSITADPGLSGVMAFYDTVSDDAISAGATFVALVDDGVAPDATAGDGIYTGTAPDLFQDGDTIEWGFGLDTDGDGSLADEDAEFIDAQITDETFSAVTDGYPACLKTNTGELDNPEILVTKYKDSDDNGDPDDLEGELDGWTMTLYNKSDLTTAVTSGVTGTDGPNAGEVLFDDLTLGETYVVCETLQSDWLQTYPSDTDTIVNPDDCHEVGPLGIDESASVEFHNTPLSEIRVGFWDLTGYTDATIVCTVPDGDDADSDPDVVYSRDTSSDTPGENFDDVVLDDHRLRQGEVTCTFDIVDP